jgi:hypothetical protein
MIARFNLAAQVSALGADGLLPPDEIEEVSPDEFHGRPPIKKNRKRATENRISANKAIATKKRNVRHTSKSAREK